MEIYWRAVRCIGGIYHDFSCAEGWHYQYAVFIIIGQLVAAMIIDHFGLIYMPVREVTVWKMVGMLVVMGGLLLFFFGDKWFSIKG